MKFDEIIRGIILAFWKGIRLLRVLFSRKGLIGWSFIGLFWFVEGMLISSRYSLGWEGEILLVGIVCFSAIAVSFLACSIEKDKAEKNKDLIGGENVQGK